MADNTTIPAGAGGDTIATDDLTTLNGGAVSGVKAQRLKVGFGPDGTLRDVDASNPMPASTPNGTATGTITAANATPATTGAAASYVQLTVPDNHASWTAILGGAFSAGTVVSWQASIDGTYWVYTNARRNLDTLGANEGAAPLSTDVVGGAAPTGGNPSLWKGTGAGVRYIRAVCTTYTAADAVTVSFMSSAGLGGTFLLGPVKKPNAAAALTSVTAAAATTSLLAANGGRLGASVFNDSTATLYLALAATASTTAYTVQVPPGGYWEAPNYSASYTGAVSGIWSAANGAARVTEWS